MKTLNILMLMIVSLAAWAQPNAPDIVVSKDGKGHFTSIEEAIMSVRDYKPTRTTIYVKKGIYEEKIIIPANKCDITIIGEDAEKTIITWADYAAKDKMGTFKTWTMRVDGRGIRLENLTIQNTAGRVGQAVALHIEGDMCEVMNCRLLGDQDTLFCGTNGNREYFRNCHIEGTTDFIFGPATVWFETCELLCKANSYITAASTPEEEAFGMVFNNCQIKATAEVDKLFLGRPWRAYSAVVFMNCQLPSCIVPEGWHNWGKAENEKTSRYAEYKSMGEGASPLTRVKWSRQLTESQAAEITLDKVMKRETSWDPAYAIK
ncbi:MAG: pectinesterase family protein [Bacteroidales bacterium]|nr:pectinesterase family protein [Bacteroidales bacterium]